MPKTTGSFQYLPVFLEASWADAFPRRSEASEVVRTLLSDIIRRSGSPLTIQTTVGLHLWPKSPKRCPMPWVFNGDTYFLETPANWKNKEELWQRYEKKLTWGKKSLAGCSALGRRGPTGGLDLRLYEMFHGRLFLYPFQDLGVLDGAHVRELDITGYTQ